MRCSWPRCDGGTLRDETRFVSHGVDCAAWIYGPDALAGDPSEGAPAIVMAHGFGCIRDLRLPAYAERFRDAGFVVVVFDYRHFGASGGSPRQLLDIRRQLDDWRAALAFTRALPAVDRDRVIAWGTSFSGGHVLTLAGTGSGWQGSSPRCPMSAARPLCGRRASPPHAGSPRPSSTTCGAGCGSGNRAMSLSSVARGTRRS